MFRFRVSHKEQSIWVARQQQHLFQWDVKNMLGNILKSSKALRNELANPYRQHVCSNQGIHIFTAPCVSCMCDCFQCACWLLGKNRVKQVRKRKGDIETKTREAEEDGWEEAAESSTYRCFGKCGPACRPEETIVWSCMSQKSSSFGRSLSPEEEELK